MADEELLDSGVESPASDKPSAFENIPPLDPEKAKYARISAILHAYESANPADRQVALDDIRNYKVFPEVDQTVAYAWDVENNIRPREEQLERENDEKLKTDPLAQLKIAYFKSELERRREEQQEEAKREAVIQAGAQIRPENGSNPEQVRHEDLDVFRRLEVDKEHLFELLDFINKVKDEEVPEEELDKLKLGPKLYFAVPLAARAVLGKEYPTPTKEQIKQFVPWLDNVSGFIGRFSQSWGEKFKNSVHGMGINEAKYQIDSNAFRARIVLEVLGQVEHPRQQILGEVEKLYVKILELSQTDEEKRMQEAQAMPFLSGVGDIFYDQFGSLWDEKYGQNETVAKQKMEKVIASLFSVMNSYSNGRSAESVRRFNSNPNKESEIWFNEEEYPAMIGLIRALKLGKIPLEYSVAAAEMMGGIGEFLAQNGRNPQRVIPEADQSPERWVGELIKGDKIKKAREQTPAILGTILKILPQDGPVFKEVSEDLLNKIVLAQDQGMSDEQIVGHLFP